MTFAQYAALVDAQDRVSNPARRKPASGSASDLLVLSQMRFTRG